VFFKCRNGKKFEAFIGAFQGEGSVLRLLVPLAVDTNAKWLDRKYVSWRIWNMTGKLMRK